MITYGHEKYIEEAIKGVFIQQTDFPVELIISNDCSPDNTDQVVIDLLKNTPSNITIKYTRHEKNLGVMSNFIWALTEARGQYIALCEGDDYWIDPMKLQKQVVFLERNPDYVLTGHRRIIVDEKGQVLTNTEFDHQDLYTQCLLFKNVIKKDFLNFSPKNIINGDTFLILYLKNFGKNKILDFCGSAYRVSSTGAVSMVDPLKRNQISKKSLNAVLLFFEKYKYRLSAHQVKALIISNKISYFKLQNNPNKVVLLSLLKDALTIRNLGRIKSILQLLFK